MRVGYARVSTEEQDLALQIDALNQANCDMLFTDRGVSGATFARPGLTAALESLASGDALVVWRLDRLGRSLRKLVELTDDLAKRGIEFVSLTEAINTSSTGGILVLHVMAALAEFERSLISERTRAGLAAARARGTRLGRRHALDASQQQHALALLETHSYTEVARQLDVHTRTLKRLVQAHAASSALRPGEAEH
ncbi:recombinase family protein [Burkholderia vietnamiensis]|uniref:recombinase family protein n=1 Tax=Burkholderia vietnamiensis TaxID=60552 RepID=UPI000752D909|nr:recombinase family protein [Burkholderia vietnamiensis]KVF72122.1 hypothetical protein WJ17_04700 [Burkholderia vietnamiensis]